MHGISATSRNPESPTDPRKLGSVSSGDVCLFSLPSKGGSRRPTGRERELARDRWCVASKVVGLRQIAKWWTTKRCQSRTATIALLAKFADDSVADEMGAIATAGNYVGR